MHFNLQKPVAILHDSPAEWKERVPQLAAEQLPLAFLLGTRKADALAS